MLTRFACGLMLLLAWPGLAWAQDSAPHSECRISTVIAEITHYRWLEWSDLDVTFDEGEIAMDSPVELSLRVEQTIRGERLPRDITASAVLHVGFGNKPAFIVLRQDDKGKYFIRNRYTDFNFGFVKYRGRYALPYIAARDPEEWNSLPSAVLRNRSHYLAPLRHSIPIDEDEAEDASAEGVEVRGDRIIIRQGVFLDRLDEAALCEMDDEEYDDD